MQSVDIIVESSHVLTMDGDMTVIPEGAIAVSGGKVVALGPASDIRNRYCSETNIGGCDTIAFPGLINTHTHSPMVLFRGLKDDLPLKVWLEEHIWPAEERWLGPEFVRDAVELACLEMLRAGVTGFCDMYFYGDVIAATAKRIGMRAVVGAGILDFPSKTASTPDEYFGNAETFIQAWKGDGLIIPAIAPHALYTCSPETVLRAKGISGRYGIPMHLHLAETEWEVGEVRRRYSKSPVGLLEDLGVLDEKVIAAHCVWLSDDEITTLARRRVNVSHCIESNLKLASGIAPVPRMLASGVKVSFGTDGAASNNDLNVLSEMATAAKVHKAISGDPTALPANQVVLMATRWGAEALGIGATTGSIEKGKSADIVIANIRRPHLTPLYDVYSHIVYAMTASDVESVIVNGRLLIHNGKLTTADEEAIIDKAVFWGKKIRASA